MATIIRIDPFTDPRWEQFLESHPAATIFHHPNWLRVIESCYGYKPFCLAVEQGGRLVGVMPLLEIRSWLTGRRAVCLPFSDFCGPLLLDRGCAAALISYAASLTEKRNWRYCEIRADVDVAGLVPGSRFKYHQVELDGDSDRLFHTFKRDQVQRNINKAIRSGVTVERRTDAEAMQEFMRLNALTRKKHGVPPQPDRFFHAVHEHVILQKMGFISVAAYEGAVIAASVFLHYKSTVFFKYGASDEQSLARRPNNLVMWDAIKWGSDNGYKLFDFGRTDLDNAGLLSFKRGWGTVESDLTYYRLYAHPTYDDSGISFLEGLRPFLRKLPVSVLKAIGKGLYKHVG